MTDYLMSDDEKRAAALAKWREDVRVLIRGQVPEIKAQLADLTSPDSGIPIAVAEGFHAIVSMQTALSVQAALNHQIAVSAILASLPEEKRGKALEGMNSMAGVVSEEIAKLMDMLF